MTSSTSLNPYKEEIDFAQLALQDVEFAKMWVQQFSKVCRDMLLPYLYIKFEDAYARR